MSDLSLSMKIERGSKWIELEDPGNGYELHAETYGTRSVTHRSVAVESAWLEGTYFSRGRRENIMEVVAVFCYGDSHGDLMERIDRLTSAFDQNQYRIQWTVEDHKEIWNCSLADYSIETSQPLLTATQAIVKANVPRLPKVVR